MKLGTLKLISGLKKRRPVVGKGWENEGKPLAKRTIARHARARVLNKARKEGGRHFRDSLRDSLKDQSVRVKRKR